MPVIPPVAPIDLNAAATIPPHTSADDRTRWHTFAPQLTTAYLCGVTLMLLRLVFGLWGGRRLRRRVHLIDDASLLAAMRRQAAALGLKLLPIPAYCERVTVPTVVGVLKPMILLPVTLISGLSPEQIESVLAHELAHLRRYDHLVNLLQRVIESLLFFHPAMWWVSHRMREEREHCCDDLVVACGTMPQDYAKSLLVVAELSRVSKLRGSVAAVSLLATGDKPSNLRQRIARLLGESATPSLRISPRALLLATGIPVVAVIATIQTGASNQPVCEADESSVETPQSVEDRNNAKADRQGPRFTEALRLELKREVAHGGRWFFVDLDRGKLATPPFAVELDREQLPWTVIRPDDAALKKWLIESGVDLVLFVEPQPTAGKSGHWLERTASWSIRTSSGHVNELLAVPHVDGQAWRWNDWPELVIAPFARKNEAINVSGFVPSSSGGPDIRPDTPYRQAFRTAHNVVGFYLLEHNNLASDSLDLRIVHVANATTPLADQNFDGLHVSGKLGAADPPGLAKPIVADLPNGIKVRLVGVGFHPSEKRVWWQSDGSPLDQRPYEKLAGWVLKGDPKQADCREFAFEIQGLPKEHAVTTRFDRGKAGVTISDFRDGVKTIHLAHGPLSDEATTSVNVGLISEPLGPAQGIAADGTKLANVDVPPDVKVLYDRIQPLRVQSSKGQLELSFKPLDDFPEKADWRLVAIDNDGQEIQPSSSGANETEATFGFTVTRERLARFEYRLRPYRHWVTFENVSLQPGQQTDVKVKVESIDLLALSGLEFLKPYPKLHGLSLDMTEPQFLEIVEQQELTTRRTVEGEKVTHHIALGDGHTLIVMFDKDAKCSGIQRVRGEDLGDQPAAARRLGAPAVVLPDHLNVMAVGFDRDSKDLVTVATENDVAVRVWDLAEKKLKREVKLETDRHGNSFLQGQLTLSGDRQRVIAILDGKVTIWDTANGKLVKTLALPKEMHGFLHGLTTTPDLSLIACEETHGMGGVGTPDAHAVVWDVASGRVLRTVKHTSAVQIQSLALSPDGKFLATGGQQAGTCLWDVSTGTLLHQLPNDNAGQRHPDPEVAAAGSNQVVCLRFSPDSEQLALGDMLGVKRVDVKTGKLLFQCEAPFRFGRSGLVFSKDAQLLARIGTDRIVPIWSTQTGELLVEIPTEAHDGSFSDDGSSFAVGFSDDKQATAVWNLSRAAAAADGKAAIGPNGEIVGRFIDAATGKPVEGVTIACGAVINDSLKGGGANAVTDAEGRYRLPVPSPGIYNVWLKKFDKDAAMTAAADDGLLVEAGKVTTSQLLLVKGRRVAGKAVDAGKPLANMGVSCYSAARPQSGGIQSTKTNDEGAFEFSLPPGRAQVYVVELVAKSNDNSLGIGRYADAHLTVSATEEVAPIMLTLQRYEAPLDKPDWLNRSTPGTQIIRHANAADVTGTVVDAAGNPIVGAGVFREDGPINLSDDKGVFKVNIENGTQFVMHAFAPGYHVWFGTPTAGDVLKIMLIEKEVTPDGAALP